jgi:prepilin-type N-terminal cleavage/methylation domain-containing protein
MDKHDGNASGFSLIELLVVVVIIAVIASGVSLAINLTGSSAKQINQQGDRLFAQMLFALDDALVRQKPLGIVIEQSDEDIENDIYRYGWYRFNGIDSETGNKIWLKTDEPLGQHKLREDLAWEIEVEDESLEASLDQLLEEDEEEIKPIIVFYSTGEVSDFSVIIGLTETALEDDPEAINERFKIALDERGQLIRYYVGEVEE